MFEKVKIPPAGCLWIWTTTLSWVSIWLTYTIDSRHTRSCNHVNQFLKIYHMFIDCLFTCPCIHPCMHPSNHVSILYSIDSVSLSLESTDSDWNNHSYQIVTEKEDGQLFQNYLGNPVTRNEKRYRVKKEKKKKRKGKDVHYGWKLLNRLTAI